MKVLYSLFSTLFGFFNSSAPFFEFGSPFGVKFPRLLENGERIFGSPPRFVIVAFISAPAADKGCP